MSEEMCNHGVFRDHEEPDYKCPWCERDELKAKLQTAHTLIGEMVKELKDWDTFYKPNPKCEHELIERAEAFLKQQP